jgi:hypothetical protein
MATDLSLINAALTRTGNNPITSLSQNLVGAVIATQNYEFIVKNELAMSRWKLPTKVGQLSHIDPDDAGEPPAPWLHAYQAPTDVVRMRTVMVQGQPIAYESMGQTILCDYGVEVEVQAKYLWRIPEDWFTPEFAEGIIRRMEAVFLRGIKEDYKEAAIRDEAADVQFAKARSIDSMSQTPIEPVSQPVMAARGAKTSTTLRARRS